MTDSQQPDRSIDRRNLCTPFLFAVRGVVSIDRIDDEEWNVAAAQLTFGMVDGRMYPAAARAPAKSIGSGPWGLIEKSMPSQLETLLRAVLPVHDVSFTSNHNQKEEHTHAHTKRRALGGKKRRVE